MIENVQIWCDKYVWSDNAPPEELNFFSKGYSPTFVETVNLKNYLTDIDKLNFNFDTTDRESGVNSLFYEDASVNITVSGIAENSKMKNFFLINQNAFRTKWLVRIITSTLSFTGIVNQESIEETFSISSESEQIKFMAQSFLSEFKTYYSNQNLPKESGSLDWETDQWYTGDYDIYTTIPHQSLYLDNFFKQVFQYTSNPFYAIELDANISNFRIFRYGGFRGVNTLYNSYRLKKCSYDAIVRRGESKWGFLNKLCNAMGWIMYFKTDNNKVILCIKNRSDSFANISYLNYNYFVEYTAIKTSEMTYDAVAIPDGEVYGGALAGFTGVGAHRRSNSFYMYSDKLSLYSKTIPWKDWSNNGFIFPGSNWMKLISRGDKETVYAKIIEGTNSITITDNTLRTDKILWIDGGETRTYGYVFHRGGFLVNDWPVNEKKDGSLIGEVGEDSIYYTGNYGSALYYKNVDNRSMYYDNDIQKKIKENYKKYLDTLQSNRIKVTYYGADFSPFSQAQINGNSELNGDYNILSMAIDLKNELTEFELQKT